MNRLFRASIFSVVVCGAGAAAAEDAASVTRHGFCIRRDEMRCEEVALPGTMVAFDRLMKDEQGNRVVWYFTDQEVSDNSVLVHVLEAEDSDTDMVIKPDPSVAKDAKKLDSQLKKIGKKFAGLGALQVAPFRGEKSESYRIFTTLKVEGPGNFSGRVVDMSGNNVPISDKTTFSVFRRPG
ncbi:MAG: hypothetical protein FJX59_18295 [Alphaproteobacteria bacterium]|nr:hypothetical protein [Alphaproteobacteria bacterium]